MNKGNSVRIEWLERAYSMLRDALLPEAPGEVTISFGFPSKNARRGKNQRLGEYAPILKDCKAGPGIVSLNPAIFDNPSRVLDVLLHEMIHATRPDDGHRGQFGKLARRVGLVGKLTATTAGPELQVSLDTMLDQLPPMPTGYGDINAGRKKQSTRMLKYECPGCGQIVRAATDCLNITCEDCGVHYELAS